ncbi:TIGR04283 family arsenosugar biosynthesis glycosyltransferase [Emcibacter sp. SYSU 3D8]|uniref:TIGR04283 family arsenosugar biosynthesis glycosyltransferase n=1 Tax=Emcibacter sp. SYSU 3D8 TaxID=3133969 RepID=UPI0031FE647F
MQPGAAADIGPLSGYDASMTGKLSVIVPVLNEAVAIGGHLAQLSPLRERGAEIIVMDGGSTDRTLAAIGALADRVAVAPRGRASQMNAGAALASGSVLLFLHADTSLPPDADRLIDRAFADPARVWGRFDVRMEPRTPLLALVAFMMNWRSRLTGIATGDQAIFVRQSAFAAIGGYRDMPLMEDIEISKALRRISRPACLRQTVSASARRWQKHGVWRTIWLMWSLRLAHFRGVDPQELARRYGYVPDER